MKMEEIMERVAVDDKEKRKEAIISILNEIGVSHSIQQIKSERMEYKTDSSLKNAVFYAAFKKASKKLEKLRNAFMKEEKAVEKRVSDGEITEDEANDIVQDIWENKYSVRHNELLEDAEKDMRGYFEKKEEILENIIVDIGDFGKRKRNIILSAHYDVVRGSSGANDNGSGITCLLRFIAEKAGRSAEHDGIRIIFFDAEETGGRGSSGYIEEYIPKEHRENTILINLDVVGVGDVIACVNHSDVTFRSFDHLAHPVVTVRSFPFSDAWIFDRSGIPTFSISAFPENDINMKAKTVTGGSLWEYMHNGPKDNISYINYDIMDTVSDLICDVLDDLFYEK